MFPGCPLPVRACVRTAPERRHSSIGLPSTSSYILLCLVSFYRAMLCIRGTSHGPVSVSVRLSVRPSVTSRSSTKTAKQRITQTTPHDSPGTLVF